MRQSHEYAKDKLRILEGYVYRFITSMRDKPWRELFYIDLQAGPGKNVFADKEVMLGSPLIALTSRYAFSQYRFVEYDPRLAQALQERVQASERRESVRIIEGDCNTVVDEIVSELERIDKVYIAGKWPSLNLAFLDPEGLELNWSTVEKLGRINRMDLIINVSTSGFTHNFDNNFAADRLDAYFGSGDWRTEYGKVVEKDSTHIRRHMIDYYKRRLKSLGYHTVEDERVFKNSRNVQIYTLIAASKDNLGIQFWQGAARGEPTQPPLF
jgi:three-Cys-motif partner protein